jgi:hypothetical protein
MDFVGACAKAGNPDSLIRPATHRLYVFTARSSEIIRNLRTLEHAINRSFAFIRLHDYAFER